MTRKIYIVLAALGLFLALANALPVDRERRDVSSFDSLEDRALSDLSERSFLTDDILEPRAKRTSAERRAAHKAAGKPNKKNATQRKAAGLPALPKSRKARAQARKTKGVTKPAKAPNPASALRGQAAKDHAAARKAEKNNAKNANRNATLKKKDPSHTGIDFASSKKAGKIAERKTLKAAQRADDAAVNAVKSAGRPPVKNKAAAKAAAAAEKATERAHFAQARADHKASLATGTFPARDARFTTEKGNTFTGKEVRQAAFTAHLAAQKPVGYNSADGKALRAKDRHPKEFQNRPEGAAGHAVRPLPEITDGTKYREYGIVSNQLKGYDGRSPNPTEARVITKPNAHGVHEFSGVVAHRNLPAGHPGFNDHVQVHPTR